MIKKIKMLLLISTLMILFLLLGNSKSMASSDLFLNNLNFDVQINSDGSMDVQEIWNIRIEETNTLFKTFKTDSKKYSEITNVQVAEITNGREQGFTQLNELMYHVTKNCYYGMKNDDGNFEIAWGVGLDNSSATKTYKISYTVEDAVSKYSDYAELYWQFVGEDFEINADTITGTIILPENVTNIEDIKVWGHTEGLNGEIYATDLNRIEFKIDNFNAGRFVEVRTLFPTQMIMSATRGENRTILDDVTREETTWANEANARRTRRTFFKTAVTVITNIILILVSIKFIKNIIKKVKGLKGKEKLKPTEEIIYYREMPREGATPSEAVYMYKKLKGDLLGTDIGKIFSATLLDLNLKKIIDFEVTKDEKNKEVIKIKLLDKEGSIIEENKDEKAIFEFLVLAFKEKEEITVKDLQKHIKRSSSKILSLQESINKGTKFGLRKNKLIDKNEEEEYKKLVGAQSKYIVTLILGMVFGAAFCEAFSIYLLVGLIPLIIFALINLILTGIQMSKLNVFTQEGVNESEKWKGLKKYMEEFSMLDKREVPEIVIWEKFLVYATAFGIADKVLKQLKIVYPDIENTIDVNTYSYMYLMMHTDFSSSFSNSISSSMSSAYSSASGGGGGFSGGGGGGRWPEAVVEVDKTSTKINNTKRRN